MGYLLVDHRGGTNPDGKRGTLIEYDTSQCPHCGGIVEIRKRRSISFSGASVFGNTLSPEDSEPAPDDMFCGRCHGFICKNGRCRRFCVPWMKKLLVNANRKLQRRKLDEVIGGALAGQSTKVIHS